MHSRFERMRELWLHLWKWMSTEWKKSHNASGWSIQYCTWTTLMKWWRGPRLSALWLLWDNIVYLPSWPKHILSVGKHINIWITWKYLKRHFRVCTRFSSPNWTKRRAPEWTLVGTSNKLQPPQLLERLRSVKQICSETYISGSLNTSLMDSQAQHDGANRNGEISSWEPNVMW